ncbi:MAG: hypothetical protein ACYCWW_01015 [Deltaproteobacteria bacterium]
MIRPTLLPLAAALALCACSNAPVPTGADGGTTGAATSTGGTTSGGGTSGGGTTSGGSTGSSGPGLGTPCSPTGQTDPCASAGYQCSPQTSSCQLPSEIMPCQMNPGCAAPYSCKNLGSSGQLCVQSCAATTDCLALTDECLSLSATEHLCIPALCGPGVPSGYPAIGSTLYGSCTLTTANDGTCLPLEDKGKTIGICIQGGSAAEAATCGEARDAGTASLCEPGTICLPVADAGSACTPLCASTSNGAPADGGVDGGFPAAENLPCTGGVCLSGGTNADFGLCLSNCTGTGQSTCSGTESCQQPTGYDGGVCLP